MTGDAAVRVAGLRMSFGATEVLHGIDFDVRYGEVFCLLGPNGAGKTTTLEILEGFTAQTDGHVSVLGMNPAAQPARLRERAGMVLQGCGFPRQARVAELIDLWRSYYPNPRPLGDLLEVVELTEVRNAQVRKLSGGQRRRLDFALALMGASGSPVLCEMRGAGDLLRQQPAGEHLFRPGREVLTQDRAPAGSPGGWTADGVACPALAVSTDPLGRWRFSLMLPGVTESTGRTNVAVHR